MMDDVKAYQPYLDYPKPRKPTTNACKIRAMNDYELAVFFAKTKAALYSADLPVIAYSTQDMAENLEWLQKPAEGGTHETDM